jgi:hypothetical protein
MANKAQKLLILLLLLVGGCITRETVIQREVLIQKETIIIQTDGRGAQLIEEGIEL